MANQKAFGEEVQSYLGRKKVTDRRTRRLIKPTQDLLAVELGIESATLSRKLNDLQPLTSTDVRGIGATLIYWGCITQRKRLQRLFELGGDQLSEDDWLEEPWKYLIDDTQSLKPALLPLHNASFEDWTDDLPSKWQCNKKTGRIAPVSGRATEGSNALEIGGNASNQEWVYCRTRETQDILVVPGSRVKLSFWAKKTQEGRNPERAKYVEVAYYNFGWEWKFAQEVTDAAWRQYETEWWDVPATVQKIAVGVVVYKDGAFQADDIELHMLERR